MDLRHDPRMGRGDHDLRLMPGPPIPAAGPIPSGISQVQQVPVRPPPQAVLDMDAYVQSPNSVKCLLKPYFNLTGDAIRDPEVRLPGRAIPARG